MSKGKWDLTSLNSLHAAAEWLRKQAGGVLVLVVRGEDIAFAVDPSVSPGSAREMVEFVMPEVEQQLGDRRLAAKIAAADKKAGR
jgi:hypothetical protein